MGGQIAKSKSNDLESIQLNTDFTEGEIKTWYSWYKSVIADCSSGRMDIVEFKKMYSMMYPNGVEDKYVEHVFRSFDTNGDNEVDFREFMVSLSVTSRGTIEQKLEWAFNVYDINGDGFITQNEMLEILSAMHNMTGNTESGIKNVNTTKVVIDDIFKQLDKDKDGKISMKEFVEGSGTNPIIISRLSQINRESSLQYSNPVIL